MILDNYEKLVLWGAHGDLDSLRHIWRHYQETANKLGIQAIGVPDLESSLSHLTPDTLVLAADVWSKHIGVARPGVDYVLHNFDGSHELCRSLEDTPERILRIQVYTNDSNGEEWAPFRLYNREGRVLFQPWGTNLLPEEFFEPVYNLQSNEVTFVGAVWSDQYQGTELGNEQVINELKALLAGRGLKFRHLTHVTDEENVAAVRSARLAPAFAGQWQVDHNYLPCRVFKNISYGTIAITNVPAFKDMFRYCGLKGETVAELLDESLNMKRSHYVEMVKEQQRVIGKYSYRDSLLGIERALIEGQ